MTRIALRPRTDVQRIPRLGTTLARYFTLMERRYGHTGWWPGDTPFEIAVGAILTQNTAWRNVEKAIANLKAARLLSARAIVNAPDAVLESALRPSGYFRVKARRLRAFCMHLDAKYGGSMKRMARQPLPALREELLAVHGIGHETADDILLYACGHPVFVVDAYTRRLLVRHGHARSDIRYEEMRAMFERHLVKDVNFFREYHALIVYTGKDYCRSKPNCNGCPLAPTLRAGEPRSVE